MDDMRKEQLHREEIDYAALDLASLEAELCRANRDRDKEALEPVVRQLVLRSTPVVTAAVQRFAPEHFAERDLRLIEREAMTKLLLALTGAMKKLNSKVIAHELARECAEDPSRTPLPPPLPIPRPRLRLLPGGQLLVPRDLSPNGDLHG
jgi:hypothetical protein